MAKYEVEDVVWYLAPRMVPGKTGKITKRWTGPWKIVRRATEVHYVIRPASPTANIKEVTAHIGRLRRYTGDLTANHIPADIQDDLDGDEDATELPARPANNQPGTTGQLPLYQPSEDRATSCGQEP